MDRIPAGAWDGYWARALDDPFEREMAQAGLGSGLFTGYLRLLRRRRARRLLLAGNGCSLLPHALALLGFEVTALDFSAVASRAVAEARPAPELLARFLPQYRERRAAGGGGAGTTVRILDPQAILDRAARDAPSPGSLGVVTADVLDWEPPGGAPPPFDAVYDDRLAMLLPPGDWPELARRYARWLGPAGLCVVHTANFGGAGGQDGSPARAPFEAAFADAGFREQDSQSKTNAPPQGRIVYFMHGSG